MKRVFLTFAFMVITCVMLANHWSPIGGTQYNMTMSGIILIDGVEQTGTNLEVGAFCGDECRGSMRPEFFPPSSQYVVALTVVSNVQSGEAITFRLFDHSTNQELDLVCINDITFNNNDIIGTLGDWFEFSFLTPSSTVTYTLPITGYESTPPVDYYLIAPPFNGINPAEIEGMTNGNYDLYYFEQNPVDGLEWINYKPNGAFNLESGKGYLYAHDTDVTLSFTGEPYSGDGKVTLRKVGGQGFEGWNLIGNPFGTTATIGERDFYRMNSGGTEIIVSEDPNITAMEGVFVLAASDGETVTFTKATRVTASEKKVVINLGGSTSTVIDRAIVRFGEGGTLPKFMLNESNSQIFVPQGGTNYAVVRNAAQGELPLHFKAAKNGEYTLSVNPEGVEMNYLHLIDNMTGADVDLLKTNEYTFTAKTSDYTSRFRLVFDANSTNADNEAFAFISNGNIVINGEGTLQIVDVTGRVIRTVGLSQCGSRTTTSGIPAGVYVLRLINGNNIMTQKIVIE